MPHRPTAAAAGLFFTTNGCPLANCWKPFDRFRDNVSAAPPAPTVTRSRTGRSGHCAADCAKAGTAAIAETVTTAILMNGWRIRLTNGMAIPPKLSTLLDNE